MRLSQESVHSFFFSLLTVSKEALIVEESLGRFNKKKKSKKKSKKSKTKAKNPENNPPGFILEDMLPKEGENTVLLDKAQTKRALPLGAVEIGKNCFVTSRFQEQSVDCSIFLISYPIGTIAETEPEDEDEHLEISEDDDNSEDLQLMTSDHDLNSKVYR